MEKPETYNRLQDVADNFDVSSRAVSKWKSNHPECPLNNPKPWDKDEVDGWHFVTLGDGRINGSATAGLTASRERLVSAQADLAEHKLAIQRGEYVSREDAKAARMALIHRFKDAIGSLPRRMDRHTVLDLVEPEKKSDIVGVLTEICDELLRELVRK